MDEVRLKLQVDKLQRKAATETKDSLTTNAYLEKAKSGSQYTIKRPGIISEIQADGRVYIGYDGNYDPGMYIPQRLWERIPTIVRNGVALGYRSGVALEWTVTGVKMVTGRISSMDPLTLSTDNDNPSGVSIDPISGSVDTSSLLSAAECEDIRDNGTVYNLMPSPTAIPFAQWLGYFEHQPYSLTPYGQYDINLATFINRQNVEFAEYLTICENTAAQIQATLPETVITQGTVGQSISNDPSLLPESTTELTFISNLLSGTYASDSGVISGDGTQHPSILLTCVFTEGYKLYRRKVTDYSWRSLGSQTVYTRTWNYMNSAAFPSWTASRWTETASAGASRGISYGMNSGDPVLDSHVIDGVPTPISRPSPPCTLSGTPTVIFSTTYRVRYPSQTCGFPNADGYSAGAETTTTKTVYTIDTTEEYSLVLVPDLTLTETVNMTGTQMGLDWSVILQAPFTEVTDGPVISGVVPGTGVHHYGGYVYTFTNMPTEPTRTAVNSLPNYIVESSQTDPTDVNYVLATLVPNPHQLETGDYVVNTPATMPFGVGSIVSKDVSGTQITKIDDKTIRYHV